MFTYQVLFWCWEKLRLDELREEKGAELKQLEAQVEEYRIKQVSEKESVEQGKGKSGGWFSW